MSNPTVRIKKHIRGIGVSGDASSVLNARITQTGSFPDDVNAIDNHSAYISEQDTISGAARIQVYYKGESNAIDRFCGEVSSNKSPINLCIVPRNVAVSGAVEISRQGDITGKLEEKTKTLRADVEPVQTAPRGAISWAQAFAGFIGRLRQFTATIRDSTAFIRAMLARSVTKSNGKGKLLVPIVREAKGKAAAKSAGQVHLRPLRSRRIPLGWHIARHATKTNVERVPVKRITVLWRSFVKAMSKPPILRLAIPHAGRDLNYSLAAGVMDKRPPKPMEHQVLINVPTKHGMIRCIAARLNTTAWGGNPTVRMQLRIKATLLAGLQRLLEPCAILVPVTVSAQKLASIQAVRLGGWRYLVGVKVTGQAVSILPAPVQAGDLNSSETKGTAHYFPAKVQGGTYLAPALETGCITTGTTAALAGGYLVPCNEKGRAVILLARQMASTVGNRSITSAPELATPYAAPVSGSTLHYSLNAAAGVILPPILMAPNLSSTMVVTRAGVYKFPPVRIFATHRATIRPGCTLCIPARREMQGRTVTKTTADGANLDSLWWPWFWVGDGWWIRQTYEATLKDGILEVT